MCLALLRLPLPRRGRPEQEREGAPREAELNLQLKFELPAKAEGLLPTTSTRGGYYRQHLLW
jgi:hypothetical protein